MVNPEPSPTPAPPLAGRSPTPRQCGLHFIDQLLAIDGAVTGAEADCLLDFRQLLVARENAEAVLRTFCELRLQLESRHYLAFYRLRRCLEREIGVEVRTCPAADPSFLPLKLNRYCVEAVRRQCLCLAVSRGVPLAAPRLKFSFLSDISPMGESKLQGSA